MWKFIFAALTVIVVVVFGFSLIDTSGGGEVSASAALQSAAIDPDGFARAIEPRDWQFPRDHGAHEAFQTEWWYYTGNLATADGRRFGFQFTIFRRAILPTAQAVENSSSSEWRTNQIYLVHFTVSDITGEHFYHAERFSRGGGAALDLAGAEPNEREPDAPFRVWIEDMQIVALNDDATRQQITAAAEDDGVTFRIDMTLEQTKPPALQGDNGLSPKGDALGNASYYYSLSRLVTEGTITVNGETFAVTGNTWMDHEFSTSALAANAQGWDWFGLIFEDGREMMVGQIRLTDDAGTGREKEPAFGGLLINADGSTRYLASDAITITPTATWESPHSSAIYPAGWEITVDIGEAQPLQLQLTPLLADQELQSNVTYWEGAVRISGDVTGYGYAELTGYLDAMAGRF